MKVRQLLNLVEDTVRPLDEVLRLAEAHDFHPAIVNSIIERRDCPLLVAFELSERTGFDFSTLIFILERSDYQTLSSSVILERVSDELGKSYRFASKMEYVKAA